MKSQAKRQTAAGRAKAKQTISCQEQQKRSESPNDDDDDGGGGERHFRPLEPRAAEAAVERRLQRSRINLSDDDEGATSGSSGRGGSGSGFSSGSSDADAEENAAGGPADAHKRSSDSLVGSTSSGSSAGANLQRQPAAGWNFVPQRPEAVRLIEQVRARFLETLNKRDQEDKYDQLDLNELRKPLPSHTNGEQLYQSLAVRLIGRFLDFERLLQEREHGQEHEGATEAARERALAEAADKLRDLLQFRRHYELSRVLVDQFCKEIYQLHGIFPFGNDRNNLPVLYLRARVYRRWSAPLDEAFKRYVAWQVDVITKSNHGARPVKSISSERPIKDGSFGICFDCLNVSYACVDMDFLRYLVKILVHYYPTYCRYALCVDLPWLFRSVWKLVRSWLPAEAQKTVHLISSEQLTEFIEASQIPNSMRIDDLAGSKKSPLGRHRKPAGFESLQSFEEQAKGLNLSSSETKQFKHHMEKVLKEYEQLGAI